MPSHNLPHTFSGLAGIINNLASRLESLERRPRFGIERITIAEDSVLDPVTRYVWVDTATGIAVTLPDAWDGATVSFKNLQATTVTVIPVSGLIDGGATATVFGLNTFKTFQSD